MAWRKIARPCREDGYSTEGGAEVRTSQVGLGMAKGGLPTLVRNPYILLKGRAVSPTCRPRIPDVVRVQHF